MNVGWMTDGWMDKWIGCQLAGYKDDRMKGQMDGC